MKDKFSICKTENLIGIVACGGKSSRMGSDKSRIDYHGKAQCYYLYELLSTFCERVFISCNSNQAKSIERRFDFLVDHPEFENIGPMAVLLTAFKEHPGKDLLVIGCDYPLLESKEIERFLFNINRNKNAAFYNEISGFYEPLLAYYQSSTTTLIEEMFCNKQYSLQHVLGSGNALKFLPSSLNVIKSVNTKEDFLLASKLIRQNR